MKQSQLPSQFPAVSTDLPLETQKLLIDLEGKLVGKSQSRVLVQIDSDHHLEFFLVCIERLLRYMKTKRLLVLTSASSYPLLQGAWEIALSKENGQLLMNQFPTAYSLTLPLSDKIRVCISTVRELQLQQIEYLQQLSTSFDIILVYDFPKSLSPVWRRVIEKQQVNYLIGLCENPKQEVIQWFGDVAGGENREEGRTPGGFTQRPTTI